MVKYKIGTFPQSEYSFRLYDNTKKLSWQKIKKQTGCHALINLGYFKLKTLANETTTMLAGKWTYHSDWSFYGILINKDGYLTIGTDKQAVYDYMEGCPPVYVNGQKVSNQRFGKDGATYLGVKPNGDVVLFLCSKDQKMSSDECEKVMLNAGCNNIMRWDGSWSSQGSLGDYGSVDPSQKRIVRTYLLVYKRKDGVHIPVNTTPSNSSNNVQKGEAAVAKYTITPVNKNYKCTGSGVRIRSTPDSSSTKNVIGSLNKGAIKFITEKSSNGWLHIKNSGWISAAYMSEVYTPPANTTNPTVPTTPTNPPTYVEKPDTWAETAWQKATDKKIFDGAAPKREITRQELAVVLDRCGLLK